MGGCMSKNGDSTDNRVARWRSTGIVALRDSKLKALLSDVFSVDRFVRTLDLTNNKIVEVPSEISTLINMQRMVLSSNLIERLPSSLENLKSLKVLTLDGNRITTLPDEYLLPLFPNNEVFYCVNGLSMRLERLSITQNSLTCLPKAIGDLRNLLLLNVSNNKLKSLPESIGGCISLEELQANDNSIDHLPSSICNIIHLKSLSLKSNNLHQLPQNLLKDCKILQNISLHDNPITMEQFQQMEGFQQFEERRKKKFDKQIDSNVIMSSNALDEGLDL